MRWFRECHKSHLLHCFISSRNCSIVWLILILSCLLIFNTFTSLYALTVIMFHLSHLSHQVGHLNQFLRCITSGDHYLTSGCSRLQYFDQLTHREEIIIDGDGCLIQYHHVIRSRIEDLRHYCQSLSCRCHILIGRSLHDEATPAELPDGDLRKVLPYRCYLGVVSPFHELCDVDTHPCTGCSQCQAEGCRTLSFAVPGIDL